MTELQAPTFNLNGYVVHCYGHLAAARPAAWPWRFHLPLISNLSATDTGGRQAMYRRPADGCRQRKMTDE